MMPNTEFEFTLPKGLVDPQGNHHRRGMMRLSTAKDELALQKDVQVQNSPAYGVLVRLSQVIIQLGNLSTITPQLLENLFILDLAYLREFYNRINQTNDSSIAVQCPQCNHQFQTELTLAGES
jgi:Zn finger protein HypA/HybF involved in hydrogenase expression